MAPHEGRFRYIHEAEERTKKKFLEISVGFEISKFGFFPLLHTTSPVAGFRFRVTSSKCLISEPPGSLFFFCFNIECQLVRLRMTCALVLELYGSMVPFLNHLFLQIARIY